ncbi:MULTISPECIES: SMI1/KNR4 family protein [Streptomyces]|uniref:SMI1/KNR4 family protein n=1 Tax=Streptomyces solicathayae TaxID=3081768 RepID=A0ABZ0LVJ6_9ACTN|nr:SMI1/KNR4 family protein [Streptomyces sp. HUAS YS2]WOX22798.1 SMI1/KNR4 family protein [Streptomyces sp. HUAS YS2]
MSSLHDFATWEPLLRLMRARGAGGPGGRTAGRIGRGSWSVPGRDRGRASLADDWMDETAAVKRVREALAEDGTEDVAFAAEFAPDGRARLHLLGGSSVEPGIGGPFPEALLLVEGAVAEPWRRLPEPVPGAVPAPTADPALLERTLRERLPDAVGATEQEIAAAEARLGITLPEELRTLYRVVRAHWEDWDDDYDNAMHVFTQVGCELLDLDRLYAAEPATRPCSWRHAATRAAEPTPDDAVQDLVGSAGWIVFGDTGGGDAIAVDLTPGPRGHVGQIIVIGHEGSIGAALVADSLTDLVLDRTPERRVGRPWDRPAVAHVNHASLPDVEAAAHPALEVLCLGVHKGEPLSLEPVMELPRLRTLTAYPGTLADPLEIARLTGLEFLELCPSDWRTLLDAEAVPPTLKAAAVETRSHRDHLLEIADLTDEILALWNRPPLTRTVVEGDLGPRE